MEVALVNASLSPSLGHSDSLQEGLGFGLDARSAQSAVACHDSSPLNRGGSATGAVLPRTDRDRSVQSSLIQPASSPCRTPATAAPVRLRAFILRITDCM